MTWLYLRSAFWQRVRWIIGRLHLNFSPLGEWASLRHHAVYREIWDRNNPPEEQLRYQAWEAACVFGRHRRDFPLDPDGYDPFGNFVGGQGV